jgi:hypothetical protein
MAATTSIGMSAPAGRCSNTLPPMPLHLPYLYDIHISLGSGSPW